MNALEKSIKRSTGISPPALRPNDVVAVCAPAGPVSEPRLHAGVAALSQRYRVQVDADVLCRSGYLAGDDGRRTDAFNRCLRDPDVRAIILARGGYGTMRILEDLDADALRRDPKLIVGFSDATALLFWALVRAGVRGIHGPMVGQLGTLPAEDVRWLFRLMEENRPLALPPMPLAPIGARPGQAMGTAAPPVDALEPPEPLAGPLLGGNLCLLSHLLGTAYQLDFTGALLFFEDVGEPPYRIDRYLTHLGMAGVLDAALGVMVGDMADCPVPNGHPDIFAVIDERLRQYGVTGVRGAPLAHGVRHVALPLGARCELDGSRLRLLEPAVAG